MLFHWPSVKTLQNYQTGDIIVDAIDVDEARQQAKAYATVWAKENREWWFMDGEPDEPDHFAEWMACLDADLAVDPVIVRVLFIEGGE